MPFAGPALAPMISGFMQVKEVNFRWIFWLLTCFAGLCGIFIVFCLPETYVPCASIPFFRCALERTG